LIGEDITRTTFSPSGALRNMADPHNMGNSGDSYWQPKHVSEIYLGNDDNGGVHINSGIGNYAYYLYATAVSKDKAEKVFYKALNDYLTKTSQFIDLRIAVVQSASDLYGETSQEVIKAGEAFDAVGIYEEEQIDKTQDYNVNPGQEYLLSYNTSSSYPNTLYLCQVPVTSSTVFTGLSTTVMKRNVSVTDDGSTTVFVSNDSKIRHISLDPPQPEVILSDQAYWDNVAISKDGKRLAAISTEVDTSIYVYDFTSRKWAKFELYNPTTSQFNTDAGGVLYADAIEFDMSGENLIYDACNVLSSSSTDDIYYWDIGFINIWDNSRNAFGDGSISKLFGSLPKDVSIGNPVFSSNSPSIISFDYIDSNTDEYAILGTNLLTAETGVITSNASLGFPSFSKNDDKIAFSALTTSNKEVVAVINLAQNKISGSGSASILISDAKWPVYFAKGERSLGLAPVSDFTVDYKTGEAPLQVKYMDLSVNEPESWLWTFEGGTPSTSALQNPVVNYSNPGTFKVILTTQNSYGTNTNTKDAYITVSKSTGINDIGNEKFQVYPNPVRYILNINCDKDFSIKLFDLNGQVLITGNNKKQLDMSGLKPGLYIFEIKIQNVIYKQKIMKS
jgi:PKD repeat protein